jgi:hypothetical protein
MSNDEQTIIIVYILFSLLVFVALVALFVVLIRWLFRINVIVDLLKQIANTDERDVVLRRQSDLERCSGCSKEYPADELIIIDSGQLLCSYCHKMLKDKK